MKKKGRLKWFLGVLTLMICLFLISPVNAMTSGNLKVAAISGRKYENFSSNKIVSLFKRDRIPNYKNNGKIYTYSYSTDDKKLKKKDEQKRVVLGFYSTINNAFSGSTDKDLNVLYYVGHGLTSKKEDNGYGGIPVGFIPNAGMSSASDFERITYVQLLKTLSKYRGKFVIIIDACISGSVIDAAKATLSSSDLDRYVFLTSSSSQKVSWGPAVSLFIDSALNSNFQKADKNNDGCMSLTELYNYIVEKHKITYHLQNPLFYTSNKKFFNDLPLFQFNYTKLSASSISLSKGKKQTLKTSLKGPRSIKHKLRYSSSNNRVASVDNKGCVTGKSSGTAIISVCLTDSKGQECISTKSSCVVKVYGTTGIKLNSSSISLYVKDSTYISASVSGKNSKVTWKTSNSSVATVDSNGKVTGKKAGTCKITASANGKKATCIITVKDNWYQKVLQSSVPYKVKGAFDNKTYTIYRSHFDKYRLVDINKDGVKELLLYKHPEVAVFTYYKGKVVPLTYAGYARGVYLKGKYFTLQHGTSSENTCYTYTLKNGKLAKIGEYFHTTSSAYPVPIYKINGKDCSKATFFKTYNKYMQNFQYLS